MGNKKSSFVYYLDWAEELLTLPSELRLKVDDAVKRYVLYGEEPTDREVIYSMFGLMRKQIDRDADKWNDIRLKRSEAGRRGAEVTNRQKSANDGKCRQKSANSAVNVNVNGNVSSNEDIKKENYKKKSEEPLTEEEQRFVDGMKRVYPRIMKMEEPLTYKQYSDVVAQYGEAITKEKLEAMQNSKQLLGKNSSAVLTLRNWIRRELK
ncbi:MAG: hypothetical protein IJZ31_10165 [Bacteroidaceae bacterium]|nr:hypothetical protein [Bacteroidaceae bacterium]